MKSVLHATLLAAAITGAVACSGVAAQEPAFVLTPYEAIQFAADDPVNGFHGTFEMVVRATGRDRDYIYLNSEQDYRDQRCLTVVLPRGVAPALLEGIGVSSRKQAVGMTIRVEGTALRRRIDFATAGRPSGRYYYQTHVYVTDPQQISVVDPG